LHALLSRARSSGTMGCRMSWLLFEQHSAKDNPTVYAKVH
jgi:hypothetical protein